MGTDGTRRATIVRRGSADGQPLGSSGRGRLKIRNQPAGDTGYALIEGSHPEGEPDIRDHVHARHEETFLVLEGAYQIRLGDEIIVANTGDYVFIPRGTPHTYRNAGPAPARLLNIVSPADGVELLIELGGLAGASVTSEELIELHARHSATLVPALPGW